MNRLLSHRDSKMDEFLNLHLPKLPVPNPPKQCPFRKPIKPSRSNAATPIRVASADSIRGYKIPLRESARVDTIGSNTKVAPGVNRYPQRVRLPPKNASHNSTSAQISSPLKHCNKVAIKHQPLKVAPARNSIAHKSPFNGGATSTSTATKQVTSASPAVDNRHPSSNIMEVTPIRKPRIRKARRKNNSTSCCKPYSKPDHNQGTKSFSEKAAPAIQNKLAPDGKCSPYSKPDHNHGPKSFAEKAASAIQNIVKSSKQNLISKQNCKQMVVRYLRYYIIMDINYNINLTKNVINLFINYMLNTNIHVNKYIYYNICKIL